VRASCLVILDLVVFGVRLVVLRLVVGLVILRWRLSRLDENIGALAFELTPDDLRDIESAASQITVQGARYPESLEQQT